MVFYKGINYNIRHLCAKVRKSHARAHASIIYLWGALQAKFSRQNAFPSLFEWAQHEAQGLDGLRSVLDPSRMLTARMDHDRSWTSSRNRARAKARV